MMPVQLRSLRNRNICYGVAPISRLLELQVSFAKEPCKRDLHCEIETCNFKEPTNRSHPISLRM